VSSLGNRFYIKIVYKTQPIEKLVDLVKSGFVIND